MLAWRAVRGRERVTVSETETREGERPALRAGRRHVQGVLALRERASASLRPLCVWVAPLS